MKIERACEIFETSKKHVEPFAELTPENNRITGFVYKKHNERMGSLIIDSVNGKPTDQYVQGMPKLQYLHEMDIQNVEILDKLDGSNIVIYPLYEDEKVIEAVPKVRKLPVAMKKAVNQVNEVIEEGHKQLAFDKGLTVAYELWGYGHPIKGGVQYLRFSELDEYNLTALCILDQGMAIRPKWRDVFLDTYNLDKAQRHFNLDKKNDEYILSPTKFFMERFGEWLPEEEIICASNLLTAYNKLEIYYDQLNKNFAKDKKANVIATEGSVWHIDDGRQTIMIKDKATSVKEKHIQIACGIDNKFILKALEKVKMEVEDFSKGNFNEIFKSVKEELYEEFPEELVNDRKTEQKTISQLVRMTKQIKIDEGAKRFVEAVENEVGIEADLSMKMKAFAQMFPFDKEEWGGKVYQYFAKMKE
jgi:hypothetical protein